MTSHRAFKKMRIKRLIFLMSCLAIMWARAAIAQTSSVTCNNISQLGPADNIEVYLDYKDTPEHSFGMDINSLGKLLGNQLHWALIGMCQLETGSENVKVITSRNDDLKKSGNLFLYVKVRTRDTSDSKSGTKNFDLTLLYQFFRPGANGDEQISLIEQADSVSLPVNASTEKILSTEIAAATRSYLIGVTGMEDKEVLREGRYNIQ